MNPEMQTTLLNTHPPKLTAKILKALRKQLEENDQLSAVEEIAVPVPEIPLEYDQIFKELYPLLNCSLHCHLSKLWRCLSQS